MRDATGGQGVTVVYDAVGKDTFMGSLDCAQTFGLVVLHGGASGPAPAIEPEILEQEGLPVPDPALGVPAQRGPGPLPRQCEGPVRCHRYRPGEGGDRRPLPLAEVARAHEAAERRETTGAILLLP